jgi:hypothetical protein
LAPSPEAALALDEAISARHFKASEHGQLLTARLLDVMQGQIALMPLQPDLSATLLPLMHYLLGPKIAEILALPKAENGKGSGLASLLWLNGLQGWLPFNAPAPFAVPPPRA